MATDLPRRATLFPHDITQNRCTSKCTRTDDNINSYLFSYKDTYIYNTKAASGMQDDWVNNVALNTPSLGLWYQYIDGKMLHASTFSKSISGRTYTAGVSVARNTGILACEVTVRYTVTSSSTAVYHQQVCQQLIVIINAYLSVILIRILVFMMRCRNCQCCSPRSPELTPI